METKQYQACISLLKDELIPALGCTEPIAVAYAAATARKLLGKMPDHIEVKCSGNIIKNVKGVIVPPTMDMKGVDSSAVLGVLGGNCGDKLEVLSSVSPEDINLAKELLAAGFCQVSLLEGVSGLQIIVRVQAGEEDASVEICHSHTNIVRMEKNGKLCCPACTDNNCEENAQDLFWLDLRTIYEFANMVAIEDVEEVLDRQIDYNLRIAKEGLSQNYGANVGKTLLHHNGKNVRNLAKAYSAAGSDARMGGCRLPVVINSGSGNQGLTASLPVIIFADEYQVSRERLLRALVLSNLTAIHQKSKIGKLSAYCGVVSAACASGAAITYLSGGDFECISRTLTNSLVNVSGILCDGAKSSCAAKIASAVDAAILAHDMTTEGNYFKPGDGLVMDTIEGTIDAMTTVGRIGMRQTDVEILKMMINSV